MDVELLLALATAAVASAVSAITSDAWRVARAWFVRLLGRDVPDGQKLDEAQETTAAPLLERLNLTNLYSQTRFRSMDETLSFHVGVVMLRLSERESNI